MLLTGDDGTVYVTRRDSNDVLALHDRGSGRAGPPRKVISNLRQVHGIAVDDGQRVRRHRLRRQAQPGRGSVDIQ